MKHVVMTAAAIALCGVGAAAQTAEFARSDQSVGILFEPGNYAQFSLGGFNPNVSGATADGKVSWGDISPGYGNYSLGYKQALSDRLDLAVIIDQPIGMKLKFPGGIEYYESGSAVSFDSNAVTGLLRYKLPQNLSVYGGLRIERASSEVLSNNSLEPLLKGPYTLKTSTETGAGYVVGVAWEKPETGARVALTYNSKIEYDFSATEWGKAPTQVKLFGNIKPTTDKFKTTVPESINLEFQTGIARDTLLTGSVRWVHWTQFDITPPAHSASYKYFCSKGCKRKEFPIVSYERNSTTLNIGVDHRFNDQWSGAVIFGYEPHKGLRTNEWRPTDGFKSATLAASYQASDKIKITAGISYVDIGDAVTDTYLSHFSGNYGWGGGVRVGIRF